MKIKVISLLIVLLLMCGCESWDDLYTDYKDILDKGVTCEYKYASKEQDRLVVDLDKITFKGNNTGIFVKFNSNAENYIITSENKTATEHRFNDYRILYNEFPYQEYLDKLKTSGYCPKSIYLYNDDVIYLDMECPATKVCNIYTTNQTGGENVSVKDPDNDEIDDSLKECHVPNAVECKTVKKKIEETGETIYIELGYKKNTNGVTSGYYIISEDTKFAGESSDSTKDYIYEYSGYVFKLQNPQNIFIEKNGKMTFSEITIIDGENIDGPKNYFIYAADDDALNDEGGTNLGIANEFDPSVYGKDNNIEEDLEIKPITFCEENRVLKVFQILGYVIFGAKVVVPLILLILGTIDFAKAVISSSEKAPQEALKSFGLRIVAAIIVFLIPTFLEFLITLVNGASETFKEKNENCTNCLFNPFNPDECKASNVDYDNAD